MPNLKNCLFDVFHHSKLDTEEAFMPLLEDFVNQLPELLPDKWNIFEPINLPFNVDDIRSMMVNAPPKSMGLWDFIWRRKGKPKAWGGFKKIVWHPVPRHANQHFYVDLPAQLESKVVEYFLHVGKKFCPDYAVLSWGLDAYSSKEELLSCLEQGAKQVSLRSIDVQKHLPAIYWGQLYGPPYVRLFGLQKLLGTPAYKVEQLGPEIVYVQLTESVFDVRERYAEVDVARQKVAAHLDDNIIFKASNPVGHPYRVPDFTFHES
jgi:hypothetical protein